MIDAATMQFLSAVPLFADFTADDMAQIGKLATIREYEKGDGIFIRGDESDVFFVVLTGWVKIYRDTQEGNEAVLGLFTRSDTFGEAALFGGGNYPYSAQSVEKSQIITIPAHILRDRAKTNPDIMMRIMQSLAQYMSRLQLENEHLALMSAPQRVGCLLLQLSTGGQGEARTIHFPYDKSLAATRLGMKPETFSRALGQLKNVGVVVKGDQINIAQISDLAAFVCADCSAGLADCEFSDMHCCSAEDRACCVRGKISRCC